jgi:vacuolar protein sorting-associated protein 8
VLLSADNQETYIRLLCRYGVTEVMPFLLTHDDYRLDAALSLCRRHAITDATAYLLERTGDVAAALALLVEVGGGGGGLKTLLGEN